MNDSFYLQMKIKNHSKGLFNTCIQVQDIVLMCLTIFSCITHCYMKLYAFSTCSVEPAGRYIMTSDTVCRKVWNVTGRGYTASPAMVMSDRGWSQIITSLS